MSACCSPSTSTSSTSSDELRGDAWSSCSRTAEERRAVARAAPGARRARAGDGASRRQRRDRALRPRRPGRAATVEPVRGARLHPPARGLPEGSYLLHLTAPRARAGGPAPAAHARAREQPPARAARQRVPEGYVYIPPGCFLLGSADPEEVRHLHARSSPLHRVCLDEGYLIGQTEVTFGDWLTYLDVLPRTSRRDSILEQPSISTPLGRSRCGTEPGTGWVFSFHRSNGRRSSARGGESRFAIPSRTRSNAADWRQFPLSGVSVQDLEGYFYLARPPGRTVRGRACAASTSGSTPPEAPTAAPFPMATGCCPTTPTST